MNILFRQTVLEYKLFIRSKDGLFWTLALPVFFIVLFGFIYGDTKWDADGLRAIDHILPGIVVMALMTTGIMNTATGFVEERDKGIYRRLSVTPLKRQTVIGAQIITRYLLILVQTLVLLLIGVFAFNINITGSYVAFWFVLTLGGICFLALGFALTTLIRTAKSATPVSLIVFFVLLFLGGIFFPSDVMPKGLVYISQALPATSVNDALRAVSVMGVGLADIWKELAITGGWLVACLAISIKFFRWE